MRAKTDRPRPIKKRLVVLEDGAHRGGAAAEGQADAQGQVPAREDGPQEDAGRIPMCAVTTFRSETCKGYGYGILCRDFSGDRRNDDPAPWTDTDTGIPFGTGRHT